MDFVWPWTVFVFLGAVAVAIVAGGLAAMRRGDPRPTVAPEHAAGAAIVGLFGWELLVFLPGTLDTYRHVISGIGAVPGTEPSLAFLVAQTAFAGAAVFVVIGVIRRRDWGAVLGIGLAAAIAVQSVLNVVQTIVLYGESMGQDNVVGIVVSVIGLRTIPALVAIVLLARPLMRRAAPVDPSADEVSGAAGAARPTG